MPLGSSGKTYPNWLKNRKVFVTGHTGFKGSWLCQILKREGADVYGYSLEPPTTPNLYGIANIEEGMHSETGDIRDYDRLFEYFSDVKPEIVMHLAAQPLVLRGYENPRETYETNVMGTVNILECTRNTDCVRSLLNVTTDKVYRNDEIEYEFVETDVLDGFDPYSNSKSCSELVTNSYRKSFLDGKCAVSTARAGNVIGGGDFSNNRIVPDCVRAAISDISIKVRNPHSTRPYQHVIEPLMAYIEIALDQERNPDFSGSYNIGPAKEDNVTTGELVELFRNAWGGMKPPIYEPGTRHEAGYLRLNTNLVKERFGIEPRWNIATAVNKTVEWSKNWISGENVVECMNKQIGEYLKECI